MNQFNIQYKDVTIEVTAAEHYHIVFPDGKWMNLQKYPDDTKTMPVENENISYSYAFVWVVENQSQETNWLSEEEVQAIGEIIRKKDQELENK
jgi:hypothetical protein